MTQDPTSGHWNRFARVRQLFSVSIILLVPTNWIPSVSEHLLSVFPAASLCEVSLSNDCIIMLRMPIKMTRGTLNEPDLPMIDSGINPLSLRHLTSDQCVLTLSIITISLDFSYGRCSNSSWTLDSMKVASEKQRVLLFSPCKATAF